jgi:hypothetical protein
MNSVELRIGEVLTFLQELESSDSDFIVAEGTPLFTKVQQLKKLSEDVDDFQKSSISKKAANVIFWSECLEQIMDEMLRVSSGILLEVISMFQKQNRSAMQEYEDRLELAEVALGETRQKLTAFFTTKLNKMQEELGALKYREIRHSEELGAVQEELEALKYRQIRNGEELEALKYRESRNSKW